MGPRRWGARQGKIVEPGRPWSRRWSAANLASGEHTGGKLFRGRPDLHAEAFEVEVLALVGLAGAAAVNADAQEAPQARLLAGVVVAVGVGVGLQQPPPRAALAARVGLLLPALEHA